MLFDKYVTVEFRTVSGQYNNQVYVPHPAFTTVPVNIQPMQGSFTDMGNGIFFKTYKCFTTASGIIEGFRLTVSGTGEQYIVRGRQRFDDIFVPHYELILENDQQ